MTDINIIGSISKTSYGNVTVHIIKELTKLGHTVALFPKGQPSGRSQEEIAILQPCLTRGKSSYNYDTPCLNIWHQFDLALNVGRGNHAAYCFFELDTFNDNEIHHLNYPDTLFVPSKWAQEIVKDQVGRDSVILPPGVDTDIFSPSLVPEVRHSDMVIPTSFFNIGKWEIRKGHDVIVEAFNIAFHKTDDVQLIMSPNNPFLTQMETKAWHDLYYDSDMGHKIKILPWLDNDSDVAQWMAKADCGVFPSRAEGWNLGLLEMMAMGKPVIATNYSAHTEFCDKSNSMLIDIDKKESAYDGKWFHGNGNWANFGDRQMEQLVKYMQQVHHDIQLDGTVPFNKNVHGIATGEKYSWKSTAQKIEDTLLTRP